MMWFEGGSALHEFTKSIAQLLRVEIKDLCPKNSLLLSFSLSLLVCFTGTISMTPVVSMMTTM